MKQATDNEIYARYNDEVCFLDGTFEFHPEAIHSLPDKDVNALKLYYLTGQPVPENIFDYRDKLVQKNPDIETVAQAAFMKVVKGLGIKGFRYTTKV